MEKFKFNSWKSLTILIVICLVFIIFVIQAFQYIPQDIASTPNILLPQDEVSETTQEINNEVERVEDEIEAKEEILNHSNNESIYSYESPEFIADRSLAKYTNDIEKINKKLSTPPKEEERFRVQEPPETLEPLIDPIREKREKFHEAQFKVDSYIHESNYSAAIEECLNMLELTDEDYEKANIYDKLAILYAVTKQYKKAIPYAQKAYQFEQTGKREIILTKLYYKNGEVDKATKRINLIMQRDFVLER